MAWVDPIFPLAIENAPSIAVCREIYERSRNSLGKCLRCGFTNKPARIFSNHLPAANMYNAFVYFRHSYVIKCTAVPQLAVPLRTPALAEEVSSQNLRCGVNDKLLKIKRYTCLVGNGFDHVRDLQLNEVLHFRCGQLLRSFVNEIVQRPRSLAFLSSSIWMRLHSKALETDSLLNQKTVSSVLYRSTVQCILSSPSVTWYSVTNRWSGRSLNISSWSTKAAWTALESLRMTVKCGPRYMLVMFDSYFLLNSARCMSGALSRKGAYPKYGNPVKTLD